LDQLFSFLVIPSSSSLLLRDALKRLRNGRLHDGLLLPLPFSSSEQELLDELSPLAASLVVGSLDEKDSSEAKALFDLDTDSDDDVEDECNDIALIFEQL
jgi:hypothetical protein